MAADPNDFSDSELLDLLRDASVSIAAIVREMHDAGAAPLAEPPLAATRNALGAVESADPAAVAALPERLRALVLDEALQKRAIGLVTALAGSSDKVVVKEAKRVLHSLKTQGVKFEAPKPAAPAPAPTTAATPEDLPTFMTNVDGFGERILLLARSVRAGIDVAQVVVSDTVGVVDARLVPLARREFRKFVQNISQAGGLVVAEVPRPYARGLITAALDLNARARKPIPSGWHDVAFAIGPSVPAQPSPGRSVPPPADLDPLVRRADELFALDELKTWMPPEEVLRPLALKLDEIGASPLYLDDSAREEAVSALFARATSDFWTADRRRLYAERLFDLAWLLHQASRHEASQLCAASALALESEQPIEDVRFGYALFEKLLPVLRSGKTPTPRERSFVPST